MPKTTEPEMPATENTPLNQPQENQPQERTNERRINLGDAAIEGTAECLKTTCELTSAAVTFCAGSLVVATIIVSGWAILDLMKPKTPTGAISAANTLNLANSAFLLTTAALINQVPELVEIPKNFVDSMFTLFGKADKKSENKGSTKIETLTKEEVEQLGLKQRFYS